MNFIRKLGANFFIHGLARSPSSTRGFSLIEIMAALTILGIIVGLVTVNVTGALSQSKVKATKIQIANVVSALEEFNRDCHRYPSSEQGLSVLVEKPTDCKGWKPGGYLSPPKVPKDRWDKDLMYYSPPVYSKTAKFEIISYGADGVEGGQDENEDINSNATD